MDEFLRGNKRYAELVLSADYESMKKDDIAEKCEVSRMTIYNWEKQVDWDYVLQERRKKYARQLCEVDVAVLKNAATGHVPAAELAYQRWDGWIPSSRVQNEHSISDREVDEALNELIERKRATVIAIESSTVDGDRREKVEVPSSGETPPEAGRADPVLQAEPSAEAVHP